MGAETMENQLDIVVIGTIIKETIQFPNRVIGPVLGSPAAYSSLVMAAQGRKVGIVTYYGGDMDDVYKETQVLDRRNVMPYAYSTTNHLIYRSDGTKYVEYQKSAPNIRFSDLCEDYLRQQYFKICPMNYEVELDVAEHLHQMGKTVFIDLGGYGGATSDVRHSIEEVYGRAVIAALCRNSTIIKASAEDLESIIPGRTAEEAALYLTEQGAPNVVVTLGSKGVLYKEKGQPIRHIGPFAAVSEIPDGSLDFTGAGDSFGAGFMASYVKEEDMTKAAVNGNATASLVIQKTGGCTFGRMPTKEQVQRRIAENS
ncbi:MAG: carbohydrate kinase family protein [Oscillospiraceae bacterium]|jgi:sugar/nucleoside kinase (ribokinase family)|nr:carbohydrate kinase family protein [Oscillospiraceae bacterium]MDD3260358.1 carbohydrate kinase family protein [Oscillospiraceae bacterium]